ncbi:MAG: LysM peptidoglycan-binding domain-containing protein [Candidatus Nanopelagicales bacterium]|jgi:LysM repeat protein|nr:LysM peptidoglycan-binding domain-containing protein [Candidatus Nanopelagicales bacterium]
MASSAVVALWRPVVQVPTVSPVPAAGAVRLTPRGRALLAALVVVLLLGLAVLGLERLTARPALAGTEVVVPAATTLTVVVEEGDSLWAIAERVMPATDPREVVEEMRSLNGMRSNLIQPGQALLVPVPAGA